MGDIMKIIKCKKMSNGRYKVELDNGKDMIIYEDVIVKNELLGKEIDASLLLAIDKQNSFAEIYNMAVKYIGIRLRSVKEIKEYLKKKNITVKEQEEIITRLKEVVLLNDHAFAKAFINDKLHLTNYGFVKIKNTLLQHDINEEVIDDIIKDVDIDYDSRIKMIIQKQIKHNKSKSKFVLRNKIYNHLITLGYENSDILKNLDLSDTDDDNQLEKEYEKLYRKLSNKYQGKELANQLKRKLYQKGFDYSKVDDYIVNKNES